MDSGYFLVKIPKGLGLRDLLILSEEIAYPEMAFI